MVAHVSHDAGGATLHYSSRCEKFVLARFLNTQKNIKKISDAGGVSEEESFFILQNKKETVFSKKTAKIAMAKVSIPIR